MLRTKTTRLCIALVAVIASRTLAGGSAVLKAIERVTVPAGAGGLILKEVTFSR
jgi:hypothetical protein